MAGTIIGQLAYRSECTVHLPVCQPVLIRQLTSLPSTMLQASKLGVPIAFEGDALALERLDSAGMKASAPILLRKTALANALFDKDSVCTAQALGFGVGARNRVLRWQKTRRQVPAEVNIAS